MQKASLSGRLASAGMRYYGLIIAILKIDLMLAVNRSLCTASKHW